MLFVFILIVVKVFKVVSWYYIGGGRVLLFIEDFESIERLFFFIGVRGVYFSRFIVGGISDDGFGFGRIGVDGFRSNEFILYLIVFDNFRDSFLLDIKKSIGDIDLFIVNLNIFIIGI